MKNWKKYASLWLALLLCLSLAACGEKGGGERTVSMEDLEGFWYPPEGIGSTMSVLTCIYIDGTAETWEEYDQYGNPTEYTGNAYTDGTVLTLTDVPLIGDVEIPIGDVNTLVTDEGEIYWIKGEPGFKEKPELSISFGRWYLKGDRDSDFATVLTLNEDGTYTRGDTEEGTYTFEEVEVSTTDANTNETTTELRQEVKLSGGFMDDTFYLVNDGQVLVHWAKVNEGGDFYVHESALENEELLKEYRMTDGESYWGDDYTLQFLRENTVYRNYFNGAQDPVRGTWELSDDTITITWDDGETDEATLDPENPGSLTLNSTGETLAKLFS